MQNNSNNQAFIEEITRAQQTASNPNCSIWVNANAGTGKTKVLVDRILRLLLNQVPHNQILCITYTNAAAAEISSRVMAILSRWSYIEETILITELQQLGIKNITEDILLKAKILANQILDSNTPLKIQTIHGFCQSLLESFIIEAELPNNFTLLEENHSLNLEIRQKVFNNTLLELINNPNLSFNTILLHFNERSLKEFIKDIPIFSIELNNLEKQYANPHILKAVVFKFFNADPNLNYNDYKINNCSNQAFNYEDLYSLANNLYSNYQSLSKTDQTTLQHMRYWLELGKEQRAKELNLWNSVFFTTTNAPRKNVFTTKTIKDYGLLLQELIAAETKRLLKLNEDLNNWQLANSNFELLKLALFANKEYALQKQVLNFLDYNDLLYKTVNLLQKERFVPWVFYKLNQAISHILVDEAQDTSPLQWEIIKIISKEIFSTPIKNKTIFIVGDLKQSIYSFQGAKPELLPGIKEYLKDLVTSSGQKWQEVALNVSFRSGNAILELVNQVSAYLFSKSAIYNNENLFHACFNHKVNSLVEIWPLITTLPVKPEQPLQQLTSEAIIVSNASNFSEKQPAKNQETKKLFTDSTVINTMQNSNTEPAKITPLNQQNNNQTTKNKVSTKTTEVTDTILANQQHYLLAKAVAEKIKQLIKKEGFAPKDIMVLAAKRANNISLTHLIKLLKERGIATSGLDKLALNSHIAIMDIMAIAKFLLQPLYNLNLATLLKTPIFGFNDEELSYLLVNNSSYLWHNLEQNINSKATKAKTTLKNWQKIYTNSSSLLEFFSTLFYKENIYNLYLNYFGAEIIDLFNEFINTIIYFENSNNNHTLEHFIYFLENINPIINKDLDTNSNEVKLLTIHKSKGLEAKIVFLIDNLNNTNNKAKVITTPLKELPLIFKLSKTKGYSSNFLQELINNAANAELAETKRLLYVALTRSKERLYICSNTKDINKADLSTSFYNHIIQSLSTNSTKVSDKFFSKEKYGFSNDVVIAIK